MSIVIKSNKPYTGPALLPSLDAYKARVLADGGTILNESLLTDAFLFMREQGLDGTKIFSATSANFGIKESGGNITKLYSLFDSSGDVNVTAGTFSLTSQNGKFALYSAGSSANKAQAVGSLISKNLSIFASYTKGGSTTQASGPLAELWGVNQSVRGLTINYAHNTNVFTSNSYGVSGELLDIPYADNISCSTNGNGLKAYQDGVLAKQDVVVSVPSENTYKFFLASANAATPAQGYHYLTIVAHDTTTSDDIALSKFIGTFV